MGRMFGRVLAKGALVFALGLAILSSGCCAHAPPSASPPPTPSRAATVSPPPPVHVAASPGREPTSVGGCRTCGGEWARHGIATTPSCLCPTGEGDKRCRDGAECRGDCLADTDEREVTTPGPPALGYFVGRCSPYRTTFGCHRSIPRGALKAGPVPLDQPPTEMCTD